jgi:chromosome segregation protein
LRLTQIKLSGFKSFVDPTSFQVPGQLVGVVGPNGCGKSNIIDATRWVLGESKASELRGESMQDVIFNGTTSRKPAGRASVELVFDNTLGRAGGQWGHYAEISVKRVLTRDGTSTYFINNLPVRRRDVQDIFMGTGLGPRAYAIIGQGMISRIIEAKPDELRVFLEEAAGVSKYKERRRETENRLHDTRENLTRVQDILREMGGNLEKLASQAKVAEHFRSLQAEGEHKQQLLWLLRKRDAGVEQQRFAREIEQAQTAIEAQNAELRKIELGIEGLRQAHYAASDAMNGVQGDVMNSAAEVARLESDIRYVVESRNRIQEQLAGQAAQAEQWRRQHEDFEDQMASARGNREDLEARTIEAEDHAAAASQVLPGLEHAVRDGQRAVGDARAQVQGTQQAIEMESARQRGASSALQNLVARRERLTQESRSLERPDTERLATQEESYSRTQSRLTEERLSLDHAQLQLPEAEAVRQAAQELAATEANRLQQLEARLSALKQLQNDVAHKGKLEPWLAKHGLDQLPRLWQRVVVERGWESALESVLRERLGALEVGQLDRAKAFFQDAPPAKLAFFSSEPAGIAPSPAGTHKSLISLLRFNDPHLRVLLDDWLSGSFVADSIEAALLHRAELADGQCFVVKSGHRISRTSIQFHANDDEQAGMLARQSEIDGLVKQSRAQVMLADDARAAQVHAETALTKTRLAVEDAQRKVSALTQEAHELQLEVLKLRQAQQQFEARSTQLDAELEELQAQMDEQQVIIEESESRFQNLDEQLAAVQSRYEDAQFAQEDLEKHLTAARDGLRQSELEVQEARFTVRSLLARIDDLGRNAELAAEQAHAAEEQQGVLREELERLNDEASQAGLQEALERRGQAEQRLASARNELEALTAQLRGSDEMRLKIERGIEPLRQGVVEWQLKEQAARLNQEQFAQQLEQAQADEAVLAEALGSDPPKPSWLQSEVTRINNEITALGAVNLAALDELKQASERKQFLDAQQADLTEAMNTLEDAIRKIDRETRALLKETFDKVNDHFGRLFPELFGGGEARLNVTGDEILDAGVQVMAQPPGKKNSTIHLLSGGEKALTAIALVFAIFQLNPAPFCLLDEVDAPLDDANTERFANMVKKMAEVTQFLFISHNKIAMEMAHQLIGVTMQEQGVSRIVAVDIESAARLAEAT